MSFSIATSVATWKTTMMDLQIQQSRVKCNFPLQNVTITQCSVCSLTAILEIPPCVSEQIPMDPYATTDHFHLLQNCKFFFLHRNFYYSDREERGGK